MKLQTLTVIFIIIMLPITMVVSQYIETEISTISTQTQYDTILNNATYDAIKAFQLNQSNSSSSDVVTEKIRDVEASINTFYNSMASGMGVSGYTKEDLESYIPCLVYTLYDGYYIYTKNSDGNYILKPYVYYTEQVGKYSVAYTLDSYIMVTYIGDSTDGPEKNGKTITRSGYLCAKINSDDIYDEEELNENVEFYEIDSNGNEYIKVENLPYVYKENIKYYYKDNEWWSLGTNGKLIKVTNQTVKTELEEHREVDKITDKSAKEYIEKYKNVDNGFTKWVSDKLGNEQPALKISETNDPDKYSSDFNVHRRDIIQKSIKSNIESTLFHYRGTEFEFKMPELDETEWDKIINNVNLISFMQGIPLRNKYYMGYSVVTNTQSKEFVDPDEIYLLTNEIGEEQYHKIILKGLETKNVKNVAYRNIDFRRKTYMGTDDIDGTKIEKYYYPQTAIADYESIVASTNVYNSTQDAIDNLKAINTENSINAIKAYYTALYRERYVNYKSLNFGI